MQIILRNLGFSQSIVGFVIAAGQLVSVVLPLLLANIADKTGKLKTCFVCAVLLLISAFATILSVPFKPLIIIAFMFGTGSLGAATALGDGIINLTVLEKGGYYSNYRAIGTLSYVLILTLFTALNFPDTQNNKSIISAIIFCALCLLLFTCFLKNPGIKNIKKKSTGFKPSHFEKEFYYLIVAIFIQRLACSVIETLLGSYMTEVLNLGNRFPIFVALGSFTEFLFMIFAGKWLKNSLLSEWTLFKVSCIGIFVRLTLYSISDNIVVFTIGQLLHFFCYGTTHLGIMSYISKKVHADHVSMATAIYTTIAIYMSQFAGSLLGGLIIDSLGYKALFRIYSLSPIIALIIFMKLERRSALKAVIHL